MVRVVRVEEHVPEGHPQATEKGKAKGKGKEKGKVVKVVKEYDRRGIVEMREYIMWRAKERGTSLTLFLISLFPDPLSFPIPSFSLFFPFPYPLSSPSSGFAKNVKLIMITKQRDTRQQQSTNSSSSFRGNWRSC
jgi:hypothetical protein